MLVPGSEVQLWQLHENVEEALESVTGRWKSFEVHDAKRLE